MRISPLRSYKPGGSSLPVQKRFKNERNSLSNIKFGPVLTATVLADVTLDNVHYLLLLLLLILILTCVLVYMHAKV